jgi:hypothetical protein
MPGFVPDEYLAGLGMETAISVAELRLVGMRERIDGSYLVLDWEAVEVGLDRLSGLREAAARARTREQQS